MKKIRFSLIAVLALAFTLDGWAQQSGSVWREASNSCPIRLKYNGSAASVATVAVHAYSMILKDGDVGVTTIGFAGSLNVTGAIAQIDAITNSSGKHLWKAMLWECVNTDALTNNLIQETNTLIRNEWDTAAITWQTTGLKSWYICPDIGPGDDAYLGNYKFTGIFGEPSATGDVTVSIWEDNTLRYRKTITSPTYDTPAQGLSGAGTTDVILVTTNVTVNRVTLDYTLPGGGIKIRSGKRGVLGVARGTTAVSGGIGCTIE